MLVLATTLLAIFLALVGVGCNVMLSGTAAPEFWVARACFVGSAVVLGGSFIAWLRHHGRRPAAGWALRASLAAAAVLLIVVGIPSGLNWVSQREKIAESAVAPPDPALISALRAIQAERSQDDLTKRAVAALLSQWDRQNAALAQLERYGGKSDPGAEATVAEQIRRDMQAVIQSGRIISMAQGNGLIIETAPNTFRVVFPVKMRIVPRLEVHRLPPGITRVQVVEATAIGATLIYTPMNVPVSVKDIDVVFSADF